MSTSYLTKFSNKKFEINFNLNNISIFKALKKFEKLKYNNKFKIETSNAHKYVIKNFSWPLIIDKYLKMSRNAFVKRKYN